MAIFSTRRRGTRGIDFPAGPAERAREPGDRRDSELGSDIKLKKTGGTSRGKRKAGRDGGGRRGTRCRSREGESRERALMVRAAVHTCGFWYALYVL